MIHAPPILEPERLRAMALGLLQLADEMESKGSAADRDATQSLEKMSPMLAAIARREYRARALRDELLDGDLFGEPAWDMLLDLFVQTVEGRKIPVTSLCIASRAPSTTALRYINELEKRGLIVREKSQFDQRTSYVRLTPDAFRKLGLYLRHRQRANGSAERRATVETAMREHEPFIATG